MDMVVTEEDAGALRVALTGRMDAQGAEAIEPSFSGRVAKSGRNVMIDLSGVSFVGSLGIRLLISASRQASRAGKRVVLVAVPPAVAEVFSAVALDELIPMAADATAARALLGA